MVFDLCCNLHVWLLQINMALLIILLANYHIMAPSTATQQQDTRRELAYIAGVDRYLQSWCSGLAAYLTTTVP